MSEGSCNVWEAEMEGGLRSTVDQLDACPTVSGGSLRHSVSNIFRTKSLIPGLQGTSSGVSPSRLGSGVDNEALHWTIAVPEEASEAAIAQQAGRLELMAGLLHPPDGALSLHPAGGCTNLDAPSSAPAANFQTTANPPFLDIDHSGQLERRGSAATAMQSALEHHALDGAPAYQKDRVTDASLDYSPSRQRVGPTCGSRQDPSKIRMQNVEVDIYSLGTFAFKGMGREQRIAHVLPTTLASRLALFSHVLKRGKATCTQQDDEYLHSVTMWLPDIAGLKIAR